MNFRTKWFRAGVLGAAVVLAGCADSSKPLNTFNPEGPAAESIDRLAFPIFVLAALVAVAVVGGGIVLMLKFRVKPEDYDPLDFPEQTHGNPKLEWGWTAVPAIFLAGVAFFTVFEIWDLEDPNDPGGYLNGQGELDVMVIGNQWWWEYRYDVDGDGFFDDVNGDGTQTSTDERNAVAAAWPLNMALDDDDVSVANEMVIPVGQQVDLTITSRDVIHSFWIPRLNGKRDAVPGRLHTWSIEADEAGEYTGWCTEYCGLSHARMRMNVIALEQADFDAWLDNQAQMAAIPPDGSLAAEGRTIFQQQCASCHIVRDVAIGAEDDLYGRDFIATELVSGAAPNLTHFATRTVMSGAIFSTYTGLDANDNDLNSDGDHYDILQEYNLLPELIDVESDQLDRDSIRWNEAQIRRWIQNAPGEKDMDPDYGQGMPAFPGLTEPNLDALIAYLASLD